MGRQQQPPEWLTALAIIIILAVIFPIAFMKLFSTILWSIGIGVVLAVIIIIIWFWLENKDNNSSWF